MKKILAALTLLVVFVVVGLALAWPLFYVTPVIMYHNIGLPTHEREVLNSVSPQAFRRQMAFLRDRNYKVLPMDEYVDSLKAGKNLCCHSVVITFDDGILNNYTEAYPILKEFGFPATFFIGSGDVGFKAGDYPAAKVLTEKDDMFGFFDQINWDQLVEMAADPKMTIASHLVMEEYLPSLTTAQKRRVIHESKSTIEAKLGKPVKYLAYPIGGFDDEVKAFVKEAGYSAAFATNRGSGKFNQDHFAIKRIRIKDNSSDLDLWAKLSGFYNLFRKTKNPF